MREYLANILIAEIEEQISMTGKIVLDVGGAQGEFCKTIHDVRGCAAVNLEPSPGNNIWPNTIKAHADQIPFNSKTFDIVIARGVLEHVPADKQQKSIDEIYRVTKDEGLCYIMIPPWYNPHAGHGLKPFHILPFSTAKWLRKLVFGDDNYPSCKSYAEAGLYPITYHRMAKMLRHSGFKVVSTKDSHLKLHFMTRIPLIREVAVPSVAFILEK